MSPFIAGEVARIHAIELHEEAARRRRIGARRADRLGERRRWLGAAAAKRASDR